MAQVFGIVKISKSHKTMKGSRWRKCPPLASIKVPKCYSMHGWHGQGKLHLLVWTVVLWWRPHQDRFLLQWHKHIKHRFGAPPLFSIGCLLSQAPLGPAKFLTRNLRSWSWSQLGNAFGFTVWQIFKIYLYLFLKPNHNPSQTRIPTPKNRAWGPEWYSIYVVLGKEKCMSWFELL